MLRLAFPLCVIGASVQADAHHGPVGAPAFYDTEDLVILEGTLTEVFWRNPHVRFGLRVIDESGEEVFWELETGVPSQMEGGGITEDMFPVGGRVKAAGFVSRHRSDFLGLRNLLLPNGVEYAGARGELIWSDQRLKPGNAPARGRRAEGPAAQAESIFGVWGLGLRPSEWMARQDYDHVLSEAGRAAKDAFRPIDHPILRCVPRGMPERMLPGSMEFVDEGDRIVMRHFWWGGDRVIRLDRDAPPEGTPHSHLGYSVGRWEGENLLVVETTLVNYPYFDREGTPQSDRVAFEERFTVMLGGGGGGDGGEGETGAEAEAEGGGEGGGGGRDDGEDGGGAETGDEAGGEGESDGGGDDEASARLGYRLTATDPVMFDEPLIIETAFSWSPHGNIETSDCEMWERGGQGD